MKIGWSTDFIIVDGEKCAADELDRLRGSSAEWVLIERDGGSWRHTPRSRKITSSRIALSGRIGSGRSVISSSAWASRPSSPNRIL